MKKSYVLILVALIAMGSMSAVSAGIFGLGDNSGDSPFGILGLGGDSGNSGNSDDSNDTIFLENEKIIESNLKVTVYTDEYGDKYANNTGTFTIEITDSNNHFKDTLNTSSFDQICISSDDDFFYIGDYDIESYKIDGNKITFTINSTEDYYLGDFEDGTYDFNMTSVDCSYYENGVNYMFFAYP